jgi:hypothetical protein
MLRLVTRRKLKPISTGCLFVYNLPKRYEVRKADLGRRKENRLVHDTLNSVLGNTGAISPSASMSITTVTKMNARAVWRVFMVSVGW